MFSSEQSVRFGSTQGQSQSYLCTYIHSFQGIFHTNYSFPDNQTLYTDILMPRKDLKKNMCVCWWEEVYVCGAGYLGQ